MARAGAGWKSPQYAVASFWSEFFKPRRKRSRLETAGCDINRDRIEVNMSGHRRDTKMRKLKSNKGWLANQSHNLAGGRPGFLGQAVQDSIYWAIISVPFLSNRELRMIFVRA